MNELEQKAREKMILKAIHESGLHQYIPDVLTTKWKDGIDIDVPSLYLIGFANKLLDEALQLKQKEVDELKTATALNTIAEGYHLYPHPKEQQATIASLQERIKELQRDSSIDTDNIEELLAAKEFLVSQVEKVGAENNALQERCERLGKALKPFADCMEYIEDDEDDNEWAKFRLVIKNYRDAKKALTETKGGEA